MNVLTEICMNKKMYECMNKNNRRVSNESGNS